MFRNFMQDFDEDPFFRGMPSMHFDSMFPTRGVRDRDGRGRDTDREVQRRDPFQDMFQNMGKMMSQMHSNMGNLEGNPNVHSFSSSSMMSYQNDGKSQPKIMQASKSTRTAPGQVKETHRTYRDSESGIEKMAIGHHLGSKGHVIEKRRQRGGALEEERKFIELNEDELDGFERDWKKRTSSYHLPTHDRHAIGQDRKPNRREGHDHFRPSERHERGRRPIGPSKSGRLKG